MKTLIVYESYHHGNTEKVARAMAEVLGARLARTAEVRPEDLRSFDLIGFGSGIYYGRHHRALRHFVRLMPAMGKDAFVFSSCGADRNQNAALIRGLEKKGLSIKGDFFCAGYDTMGFFGLIGGLKKGRPNAADIAAAREFARRLSRDLGHAAVA